MSTTGADGGTAAAIVKADDKTVARNVQYTDMYVQHRLGPLVASS